MCLVWAFGWYEVNPQDITLATRMAANSAVGHLEELQLGIEDFDCYIECMEQYFIANDIPKAKKVAAFLSAIGAKYMNCYTTW